MTYPHNCTPQYCECRIIELHHKIRELEAEVEALNQNILAYMGACGYSVPSTYDGRRTDGVIPVCGLCDAKDKENARLREAECFKCGKSLPPDGDCYACERDELEKENAELRRQLDGVGLDRMEAAHHRDEIATLKGELAACEQCHEKLEAEIEDLLIQLAMVGVYDDHRSVPGDDISAELAVECASLKAEVERLGDQLMAASKEAGKWRTEADLLKKRIEKLEAAMTNGNLMVMKCDECKKLQVVTIKWGQRNRLCPVCI